MLGRATKNGRRRRVGLGYTYILTAIDAHSRLAYSEILHAEPEVTCVAFLARVHRFLASHGIEVERVLTENGNGYRSRSWAKPCEELGLRHPRTLPYRPQTNDKVCGHD